MYCRTKYDFLAGARICLLAVLATFALPAAGHAQPHAVDVLQKVQAEDARIGAQMHRAELRLSKLESEAVKWQRQARATDAAAARYNNSSESRRIQMEIRAYNRRCAKMLYGSSEQAYCAAWASRLNVARVRHNRTMISLKATYDSANRNARRATFNAAHTRSNLQALKNYKSWLNSANLKIAAALRKQCGLPANAGMGDMKHRCANVALDIAHLALAPCRDKQCRKWNSFK